MRSRSVVAVESFETLADSIDNKCFDLGCRDPANGSGTFGLSLDQR